MRSTTLTVGMLFISSVAWASPEVKTNLSKCVDRCEHYNCSGAASPMYCHFACQKKCQFYATQKNTIWHLDVTPFNAGLK